MVVVEFVPSVNQFIETSIKEIRVQVAETLNDGFRNFDIVPEMATCLVIIQRSEEMKITWCEIRDVVDVLGRTDLCPSRTSVLPSSNSLHQNPTIFVTLHSITISAGNVFFKRKNFLLFVLQSPTMDPSTPPSSNRDFRALWRN
ncbi:hypothetical protein AVEN_258546-1 [Araneus ventricosus]|uniref:Uncharacterized protein n=1 Tax=Araneus ventricosus TaxID=182803 RepID=A0A4Y2ST19_ARAVE|nr:hypothetical protein AVEN_238826-1 [Araneus ventricosus]GBN91444.1 hypothetical protein AVEN_258546-1 [Araneus ventricosus]